MSYMFHISQLLIDNNVVVEFIKNICFIKARTIGDLLLKGVAKGGLYQIQDFSSSISNENSLVFYYEPSLINPWQCLLLFLEFMFLVCQALF